MHYILNWLLITKYYFILKCTFSYFISPISKISNNLYRKAQVNRQLPAFKFLMSPEIFMLIEDNNSNIDFNSFYTSNVKHIVTKIRRDPSQFDKLV